MTLPNTIGHITATYAGHEGNFRYAMVAVDSEYPSFLKLIDSDPRRAGEEFYRYAMGLFAAKPPRILRGFDPQMREDLVMEVIHHCIRDDFRVLRAYQPEGKPWAGWFYMVAANKIRDLLQSARYGNREAAHDSEGRPLEELDDGAGSSNPGSTADGLVVVDLVNSLIEKLDEQCRVLLRMIADEFRPREIVQVLGLPADDAKKIADKVKYCRSKLEKLISDRKLSIDELLAGI